MTEEEKESKLDMDSARFLTVISMFSASAYQSMGKLANPMTGKSERNLEAAQGFIDILIMLKKTDGNLSSEESKILESSIADLELNFVQEKNKPEPVQEEEKLEEKAEEKAGESEEKEGEAGKSGEKQGEVGKSEEKQGEAGKSKEEQGGAGKSRE